VLLPPTDRIVEPRACLRKQRHHVADAVDCGGALARDAQQLLLARRPQNLQLLLQPAVLGPHVLNHRAAQNLVLRRGRVVGRLCRVLRKFRAQRSQPPAGSVVAMKLETPVRLGPAARR